MNSDYYPPGVTGNEPIFQGPEERVQLVECGDDGEPVLVVPSYEVKTLLIALQSELGKLEALTAHDAVRRIPEVHQQVTDLLEEIYKLEDNGEWPCTFRGEVDVTRSGDDDAEWDCPRCGRTNRHTSWDEYTADDFAADLGERQSEEARGK